MENDFVTIATYADIALAKYHQSLLEENGFHASLPGEFAAAMQEPPVIGSNLRLQVPASEVAEALQLLEEMAERGPDEDEAGDEDAELEEETEEDIAERHRAAQVVIGLLLILVGGCVLLPAIRWIAAHFR